MAADRMSAGLDPQYRIFATPEQLAEGAADWIVERAREQPHRFALCLSGGETPKRLYELIAAAPRRDRFPWERTHWFWGDERVVPHDDPRSNFHLAWEALLRHVPIPPENIHAILTERISSAAGAAEYEAALKRFYGLDKLDTGRPLFDLPSRPGEFHPEPLTDPDVNLSIHPARVTAPRLPPSADVLGSSQFDPVGPSQRR